MTQQTETTCPYATLETMYVAAIGFGLVRTARIRGIHARQLLENVLRHQDSGPFKTHLHDLRGRECFARMTELLDRRIAQVVCPTWDKLLKYATDGVQEALLTRHLRVCKYCSRDVKDAEDDLPYQPEFLWAGHTTALDQIRPITEILTKEQRVEEYLPEKSDLFKKPKNRGLS